MVHIPSSVLRVTVLASLLLWPWASAPRTPLGSFTAEDLLAAEQITCPS